jgi:hypothetical protein
MKYFLVILVWILHSFSTIAQCDQPIYLEANNITASSAELAWTPVGEEMYWILEWGLDGFTLGEGTIIDSLESPEYFLDGLAPETSYDYYVWALCEDDTSSQSALEFKTLPINNMTCDAISIEVDSDSSTLVFNLNAIPYGPNPPCWANQIAGDLWYKFELTASSGIEIITESGTSNDSHIALYQVSGCNEDSAIYDLLYCSEDISQTDWMSYIITEELSPGEYYIQCGTYFNAPGSYSIQVNSADPIVYPPNNQCEGAIVFAVPVNGSEVSVIGNGTYATDENNMGSPHVWEAFSIDACADVEVKFCGSSPTPIAIYSNIYDSCPSASPFQTGMYQSDYCEDDNGGVFYQDLPAGTYYYAVVADSTVGGYEEYTLTVSAVSCTPEPQPDTCTTWLNGPFGDFDFYFGGAPSPDTSGNCPIYTMDALAIYASEYYSVDNFFASNDYTVGVCYGEGAGTWPVELAVMDSTLNIVAWADSCQISFVAPYTGRFYIGINESGACGSSSSNTSTANGYLSITCGDVILNIEEAATNEFAIYPNPSSGTISIQNLSESAEYGIQLLDVSGKVMWTEQRFFSDKQATQFNLPELSTGLYLLKVIHLEKQSYSIQRLIIE